MKVGTMRLSWMLMILVLWGSLAQWSAAQPNPVVQAVQGEVVAINLQSTPNVIVVKVILPSKQEMIVGATVGAGVPITLGKHTIGLDGIKTGQTVHLTYVKDENGLDARSIQVRK
ncbi:MAG: hypothetical protein HY444_09010 [Nitrospirae bacterium]|nr:hypothetical protein [Nitrospirota bacterium]